MRAMLTFSWFEKTTRSLPAVAKRGVVEFHRHRAEHADRISDLVVST
jgi:hypothetical protein